MENNTERVTRPKKVKGSLPPFAQKLPEHLTNLVRIIKNNAEIKRYTSLGILNWLTQKGVINGEKKYVEFKWNKFIVTTDGWSREFSYKEPFFINCLVASFSCFANSATKIIEEYVNKEIKNVEEISSDTSLEIANAVENSKAEVIQEEINESSEETKEVSNESTESHTEQSE